MNKLNNFLICKLWYKQLNWYTFLEHYETGNEPKDPNKPKIIHDEIEKRNPNIARGWLNTLPAGNRLQEQHKFGMRFEKTRADKLAEKTAKYK